MAYKEVSIWWRIARFTSESGQFLEAEITHGTAPSSVLSTYESCANFLCWETGWESVPVVRTAAEAASVNLLMSESATGLAGTKAYTGACRIDLRNTFKVEGTETGRVPAQFSDRLLRAGPELILFDDIAEDEQQEEEASLFEPSSTGLWHTAITSSRAQKAVQHNVTILIRKITSLCKKHHYIAWPPDTFCPLLFVRNDMTGAAYHGQADNFCEVYDGISPEMLYFYSTSDEEF